MMLTLEGTVTGHSDSGHADAVTSLGFLPQPEKPYLVSVGLDGRAIIWPSAMYDNDSAAAIRQQDSEHGSGGHPANDPGTHNATIDEHPR